MALCGSKTRSGEPCKRHAVPGSARCKLHGGKSTGPKDPEAQRGNKRAATPGSIYSKFLTDEEQADFDSADVRKIDDELRLTKVLLGRVLKASCDGGNPDADDAPPPKDYDQAADRYLGRIESLTKTKEAVITQRLTNEKLRRELEGPNKGLPEPKQVIIGVEDASDPEAEQAAV